LAQHLVHQGQYVVEFAQQPKTSMALGTNVKGALGIKTDQLRPLGGNSALISLTPSTSALTTSGLQTTDKISVYDAAKDDCIRFLKRGDVTSCSPNFVLSINDTTPNDPQFASLWGLNASKGINAPRAWNTSTGSADIVVAVIDTGVDYQHPDLAENMWANPWEIPGDGIDNDNNGYVDDIHGINANGRTGNPLDDNGHGSHCAGTIGGRGNNSLGVAGVNWNVKIMALKFLTASGSGSLSAAVEAINYMVDMKLKGVNVRVSSNSWGGGGFSQSLANAIKRAVDNGIVFVAAAGNENNNNDANPSYPASYDGAVSVAAIDQNRNIASFSNYGANSVDIAAPGVGIYSTYKNGGYATLSGTSMATPHVSGAFALIFASNPSLSAGDAISRLYDSGLSLSSLSGVVRTGRMLELARFINNETAPIPAPSPTPEPCSFDVSQRAFSADSSVESAPVILQGDEFNFKELDLPFSFPFSGAQHSSITVSPNGLVYVGRTPQAMDYQNASLAPTSAIAAFHADLTMDGDLGVRAIVESNRVSIYWLAEHYFMRGKGRIGVRLVINESGLIEDYVSFSTAEIENYMQSRATVGVAGPSAAYSKTYAYNDNKIRDGMAVEYTPSCSGNPSPNLTITSVKLRDPETGDSEIASGKKFQLVFKSSGAAQSVATDLVFALDGKVCQETASVMINTGRYALTKRAPRLRSFRSIKISAANGQISSRARIVQVRSRSTKKQTRRTRAAEFSDACSALVRSIQ
jgi:subtilisin family serine protease